MKKILFCLLITLLVACRQRYEAPVQLPVTGYLVVEGVVNSGLDTTILKLSRTTKLDNRTIQPETGAQVKLQGEDNSSYPLIERFTGEYRIDHLNLSNGQKYRLDIQTNDGKKYLSDYVPVITNPPIDSISWKRENGGLQLYINTHNPLGNTRYYQWESAETWEIHSQYFSSLKYHIEQLSGEQIYSVEYRNPLTKGYDSSIYYCWQFKSSANLQLGSSAKLSQDIINLPIAYIPPASRQLSVLYSIYVKQYAWSKAGYEYLSIMKKNTEATGSVFDAQPSQLNGNIHCVHDPAEPVIGYFNISTLQEKRVFIRNSDFPDWGYHTGCYEIKVNNISDAIKRDALGLLPTYEGLSFGGVILNFFAADPYCVDCTLSGTNVKPVYWP
jgi:Domain of unknown function (DUF4249)